MSSHSLHFSAASVNMLPSLKEINIQSIQNTIKCFIGNHLKSINVDADTILENTTPQQLATLLTSASIASTLGYQLYSKYQHNAKYHPSTRSQPIDYKDYKRILTASAPGKVILTGEHAVVYGTTAVSTAINKRTSITIYEPIEFHRVIDLRPDFETPTHSSSESIGDIGSKKPSSSISGSCTPSCSSSPVNSFLILKLDHASLSWKISDLIAIHNLYANKWNYKLIKKEYRLLRPIICFDEDIGTDDIERHPLFRQRNWDRQVSSVVLLLLFQCFNTLFADQMFISYGILIDVKSDIPIGVGLGSSAAWSTSMSAALYYYWVYVTAGQRKTKVFSIQNISEFVL